MSKSPIRRPRRPLRPLTPLRPRRPVPPQIVAILPIVVPINAISIVGQVVVRNPHAATSAEGFLSGAVTGSFQLTGAHREVTKGTTTQVNLRLSLDSRRLDVRTQAGGGSWTAWTEIVAG
jgi:hypothetical protein